MDIPRINTTKTKVLFLKIHSTLHICINGQNIEGVDQFLYLGIVVSVDGGTELDIARRISNTRSFFAALSFVIILTITSS